MALIALDRHSSFVVGFPIFFLPFLITGFGICIIGIDAMYFGSLLKECIYQFWKEKNHIGLIEVPVRRFFRGWFRHSLELRAFTLW